LVSVGEARRSSEFMSSPRRSVSLAILVPQKRHERVDRQLSLVAAYEYLGAVDEDQVPR
jgi:hypothetical protein